MKPSLKKLQQFIENHTHFSSTGAQHEAKNLLRKVLTDLNGNGDTVIKTMSLRIRPMRVFCFMI